MSDDDVLMLMEVTFHTGVNDLQEKWDFDPRETLIHRGDADIVQELEYYLRYSCGKPNVDYHVDKIVFTYSNKHYTVRIRLDKDVDAYIPVEACECMWDFRDEKWKKSTRGIYEFLLYFKEFNYMSDFTLGNLIKLAEYVANDEIIFLPHNPID